LFGPTASNEYNFCKAPSTTYLQGVANQTTRPPSSGFAADLLSALSQARRIRSMVEGLDYRLVGAKPTSPSSGSDVPLADSINNAILQLLGVLSNIEGNLIDLDKAIGSL